GLKARQWTMLKSSFHRDFCWPEAASQRRTSPEEAEARSLPSGLKATARMPWAWPLREAFSLAVEESHSVTVSSPLAEARVLASGLKAMAKTLPVWPVRTEAGWGVEAGSAPTPARTISAAPKLREWRRERKNNNMGAPGEASEEGTAAAESNRAG